MEKNTIKNKHKSMLITRFKQIIGLTIVLLTITTVSSFLLGSSSITVSVLATDTLVMCLLFFLANYKSEIAKQLYLWVNLCLASYLFWNGGGLISSGFILAFPVFLMVSALIASSKTFYCIFTFIITVVVASGVAAINGWNTTSVNEFGYWQIIMVIMMLSASGYTAWRFNNDMKYALKKLKKEVDNVNKSHSKIERLIHFDTLTGLSSKLDCEQKYCLLKEESLKTSNQITFLCLDIDNFKSINDYYNHSAGDELLKKIAIRLQGLLIEDDIACRLSGDEFLLVISRPKNYNIEGFSQKLIQQVSKPIELFEHTVEITVSVGVSFSGDVAESFESILKRVNLAMKRAKQPGKNKCSFYDEEIYMESMRELNITNGLQSALNNDDLEIFLQPKVDLVSGEINSAEALLRWVDNNPENFSPDEFIPVIESTELICKIGEWVINKSCFICKQLHDNGYEGLTISVNISSVQFVRGGLENIIVDALQKSHLPPEFLELELTENVLFQEDSDILDELSRIKDLGIKLSIDDFGTGYSNLSYLSKFNVDTLKIDQSFIMNIDNLPENFAIVDAIIKMAKTLGLKTVAEGVETEKEWDVLRKLNCDFGQGFIWSKPLTSKNFLKLLSETV